MTEQPTEAAFPEQPTAATPDAPSDARPRPADAGSAGPGPDASAHEASAHEAQNGSALNANPDEDSFVSAPADDGNDAAQGPDGAAHDTASHDTATHDIAATEAGATVHATAVDAATTSDAAGAPVEAGDGTVAAAETADGGAEVDRTDAASQSDSTREQTVDARSLTRAQLAQYVDHTLLATDATPDRVSALLDEAKRLGTYSICVSPSMLPIEDEQGQVRIATVCGFPSGKHHPGVKAVEAARSVVDGAEEIDMVIDIGQLKAGRPDLVEADIQQVRNAAPEPTILKVIIESAALEDDEIVAACEAAERAGADFVKTSTGFHAAGGASVEAVRLMRQTVGDRLGVKASGGIRTYEAAIAMIEAGASRLGLSGTAAVLEGAPE